MTGLLFYCASCNTGFVEGTPSPCPVCNPYGGIRPRVKAQAAKKPKRRGSGCVSAAMRLRVFREDDWTCVDCGEIGGHLTVDHIVPLSKGGTNARENLQTMCARCNNAKGARWLP